MVSLTGEKYWWVLQEKFSSFEKVSVSGGMMSLHLDENWKENRCCSIILEGVLLIDTHKPSGYN